METKYPLTKTQLGIYIESINRKDEAVYIVPLLFRLYDNVSLTELAEALNKAIANHSVSRLRMSMDDDGIPYQYFADSDIKARIENMTDEEFLKEKETWPLPMDIKDKPLGIMRLIDTPTEGKWCYLQFHHIAYDGSSTYAFELSVCAALRGEVLPKEQISIPDIVRKELEERETPAFEEAKNWYLSEFGGVESDSMPLPDIDSHDITALAGLKAIELIHQKEIILSTSYEEVFNASRHLNVPLSIVTDGAFGYAIGIFNGSEESAFSTIYHGRKDPELKNTITMMVKTLPVSCRWQADSTVSDYLQKLKTQRSKAKQYDIFSFAEVCEQTGMTGELMFAYRGSVNDKVHSFENRIQYSSFERYYSSGTQLMLVIDHIEDHLRLTAEYRCDKYSDAMIDEIIQSYDNVLSQIIHAEKLSDISITSKAQTSESDAFNNNDLDYDATKSVADLFRIQAAKTPDAVAVVLGDKSITYRELDEITDSIAAYLHSEGIGKNDVVSVIIPRNEFMAAASIGVLKSGASYQPLDPTYPSDRLNFMVNDASAALLIADENLRPLLNEYDGKVLLTKDIYGLPQADKQEVLKYSPKPEDRFILLYTSGSTGVPKGCILSHANIVAFLAMAEEVYRYDENSHVTAYASYGFDASMWDIYPGLTQGSTIHIIQEEIRLDLIALNDYFTKQGITHAFMTTQVGRAYAMSGDIAPSLQHLSMGGEALAAFTPPKEFKLHNNYGPTEATVFTNQLVVEREYDRIPIGHAVSNIRLYVVDKYMHRLPVGAVGELWVSGPQVAMGYLNRPEKTAEVFIPNPFATEEKYSRIYRTGDIVRQLPNGMIDFIGRRDQQVKIRGFRIELSEIESIISEFPNIKDVTVQAFDDPAGGKFVAAYIVSDSQININELNAFIREQKPPYMVPAVTMQIEAIPLNQNMKVNKRALPKPEPRQAESSAVPRTANILENELCTVIKEAVGIDADICTPLSYLGLTSISSIRLSVALYKRFGLDLKSKELLGETSVESIENKLLELWLKPINTEQEKSEEHADTDAKYPLSISQQGVYADTMRNPQSTTYNIPIVYTFPASQDAKQLADCMTQILNAHPYLQACLTMENADVEQYIPKQSPKVSIKEMTDADYELYRKSFVTPINLMKAPLYHIEVVKTEKAVYLLLDIHHIIFDGTSMSVLMQQLKTLLEGGKISAESHTYFDYVKTEQSIDKAEAEQFFAKMLADCDSSSDIAPNIPQTSDCSLGESRTLAVSIDFERIDAFCRNLKITPAALMLAATGYTIARFTSSRHAYISTVSTGRNDVRFADTMGMFVKTLPVHINIEDISAEDFAKATSEVLNKAVEHEIYPYSKICHDYNYAPHIMYEYQLGVLDKLVINDNIIENEGLGADTLKFKIAIRIENHEGQPSVVIYYKDGLYSEGLMRSLADGIVKVADSIVESPKAKVRRISLINSNEEEKLNAFARSCEETETPVKLFHKMFENEADRQPDKEILVAADGRFTYRELEERANRTANALLSKGLQKGDSVVVILHRTSLFFSTVFGISKAGGVFIPTSPDYPKERIDTIISDSEARFVISEGELLDIYNSTLDAAGLITFEDSSRPEINIQPDDLVYMIYTSGSTGKPKGVELRHIGICNYLTDHETNTQVHYTLKEGTCYGAVTTVAFDMAFKEWALALCNGMKLVFASDEQTMDPKALSQLLIENRVDVFNATPSRLLQYMELDDFAKAIKDCKVILSGGEKYPQKLLDLLRLETKARILNTYGPTEITVSSNAADLTKAEEISIGRPLFNYEEYIVDTDDNLLPLGVVGELIICGTGVAKGYHNLPERTAEAFFDFKGRRAYRSGDYARWTESGNVVILGRKDNQVKLRGLRIELGEIERVLTSIKGIKSGTVMIRKIGRQDAIAAYYTLSDTTLSADSIKQEMSRQLPDYMIPSAFMALDNMPLTPNGKINTKKLPEPKPLEREKGRKPETDAEIFFAHVFAEILETKEVFADDNFFELGGTSLTVTRIIIAAEKSDISITYADVFDNPTPEKLAALIEGTNKDKTQTTNENFEDISDYDYTAIDNLLSKNTLSAFMEGEKQEMHNVLLTGATGFLGIHVLYELLRSTDCHVVCLLRGKGGMNAASRLHGLFFYYFEILPYEEFPGRLTVINGDITDSNSFKPCISENIDTVINCAANVKHFSKGTDIEDVNYYGVLGIMEFCQKTKARLVHVSTMSVGGVYIDKPGHVSHLHEDMLYVGQKQVSKYTQSKFLAERAILQAVADGKLSAKIMRVGTLAPRSTDGEYQINFTTNSFMARVKSTYLVGAYPYESITSHYEMSPIDSVAQAIIKLASTPKENVIFHPYNNHQLLMGDLYEAMYRQGLPSHAMEQNKYEEALHEAELDPKKARVLTGLLAYRNGMRTYPVEKYTGLTVSILSRLDFRWPMTDSIYTDRFITALKGLGFFDIN